MECILFDCDGVLVDSEAKVLRVLVELVAPHIGGVERAREAVGSLLGLQIPELLAALARQHDVGFDEPAVQRIVEEAAHAHRHQSSAVQDIAWALERIPLRKAVVSNSRSADVKHTLQRTGLLTHFGDAIFSAEQVAKPKPAPDLYCYAASCLDVEPRRCIVVEDSVTGIAAAVAAGMTVLGFTGGGHLPPDHALTQRSLGVVSSIARMRELPSAIASIIGGAAEGAT